VSSESTPPVLEQVIASYRERRRVLIPGAAHGHAVAVAWARAGHQIVALETDVIAPPVELRGAIDLVWEQTCLCTLHPDERRTYLEGMATLLRPGGSMVALLWNHGDEGGPPYDMPPVLVERLVTGLFSIRKRERVEASLSRREPEWLWWLEPIRR
jgi:SAM-dependent methyltransferase